MNSDSISEWRPCCGDAAVLLRCGEAAAAMLQRFAGGAVVWRRSGIDAVAIGDAAAAMRLCGGGAAAVRHGAARRGGTAVMRL